MACCTILMSARPVAAHEVRPVYLEISATSQGYEVVWKQPLMGETLLQIRPRMSGGWLEEPPSRQQRMPTYLTQTWQVAASAAPLVGQTIAIDGLERTLTDALVRIRTADGSESTHRLTPDATSFVVSDDAGESLPIAAYLGLGVEHILLGIDHLLFVFGLVLLVSGWRRLAGTITAFTVAHSITLALASLGWVQAPVALVEAVIALSIMFVAVEIVLRWRGQPGLASRRPWLIAFGFGLLHGFGFASALSQIGLPGDSLVPALLVFNVGVELGQLAFVIAVLAVRQVLRSFAALPLERLRLGAPYAIGALAGYWFIDRTVSVFAT